MDIDIKSIALTMDSSIDSMLILDTDANIVFLNESCATKLRIQKEMAKGIKLSNIIDNEVYRNRKRYIDKAIKNMESVSFVDQNKGYIFLNTITPVIMKDGIVKNVMVHAKDITERELLKKYVSEVDMYYKDIIDNIPLGMGLAGQDGDIYFINPQIENLTNIEEKRIIGKNLFSVAEIQEDITDCTFPLIKHFSYADDYGNEKHIKLRIIKKELGTKELKYYFILTDITEQQGYHECIVSLINQRNKRIWALNRMAMKYNHEMQTPLATIQGYADSMLESLQNNDYESLDNDCNTISRATKKMFDLNKEMKKICEELSIIRNPE